MTGATINKNGTLRVRATKVGADTALAQIVKLVQQAQNSKAPGQQLADRAAFWLVLVALTGGTATLLIWLAVGQTLARAMLFAITVVVITCPDALGLATPTAIMVGTGLGARRGILFKNALALETSARIQVVVMDKTGTLTSGEPEVTDVIVADAQARDEALRLAAAVERESEHPLADAVVRYADRIGVPRTRAERFENVPGHGAVAKVDGRQVVVGNARLMEREGIDVYRLAGPLRDMTSAGRTAVVAAVDGEAAAVIGIADAVRPFGVPVLGMASTAHETVYGDKGIELIPEFYADLEYDGEGNLILSRVHDAVDPVKAAARVLRVVREQAVATTTGKDIPVKATTVCVHSDTPSAAAIAAELRRTLEGAAVQTIR